MSRQGELFRAYLAAFTRFFPNPLPSFSITLRPDGGAVPGAQSIPDGSGGDATGAHKAGSQAV